MKFKKYSYLIVFILILLIGINGAEAKVNKTCYYKDEAGAALVKLEIRNGEEDWSCDGFFGCIGTGWDRLISNHDNKREKDYSLCHVNKLGKRIDNDSEAVMNWYESVKKEGMTINAIHNGKDNAKKSTTCPAYLMLRTEKDYSSYEVYASNSDTVATQFVDKSNGTGDWKSWKLSNKDKDGNPYTKEEYYDTFVTVPDSVYNPDAWCDPEKMSEDELTECMQIRCDDLFGDKNDDGTAKQDAADRQYDINKDGTASIAYMVDSILDYVRVIVPILIIIIGVIDLSKAVISSKEDEMRKAQLTFIKRLLLGLLVFFIPLVVDVLMDLADLVWESSGYSSCEFR